MTALTFAVVLLGALCVLNLLLTFGLIRRLRQDAGTGPRSGAALPQPPMAPVGTAVRGTSIGWDGETLVGFFSPGCGPCEQQVPAFVDLAGSRDRHGVLAVVFDPAGQSAELVRRLGQVARVVVEDTPDGALQTALQVKGYPSYCIVRDGIVVSVAGRAADLDDRAARIPA
jgi:thiol-disulfide isomerase/thioredoxin